MDEIFVIISNLVKVLYQGNFLMVVCSMIKTNVCPDKYISDVEWPKKNILLKN